MSVFGSASGGDVTGIENQLAALTPQFESLSNQAAALEPNFLQEQGTFNQEGQDIYAPSLSQFQAGAAGQITPAQQAAVNQTLQQQNLQTAGTYGNLGLGGSTMQTQDTNANAAKSLAQTQGFSTLDESLGLSGLQQSLGYQNAGLGALSGALGAFGTAGQILGGATQALGSAGNLAASEQQTQLGLLGGLGSAIGGSSGLFGSGGLAGLFGGGAGAGAGASTAADILAVTGA